MEGPPRPRFASATVRRRHARPAALNVRVWRRVAYPTSPGRRCVHPIATSRGTGAILLAHAVHDVDTQYGNLLRGCRRGPASRPHPRLAAEPPHVGRAGQRARRRRATAASRTTAADSAIRTPVERLRLRYVRVAISTTRSHARPEGRRARRILDGRRRSRALHRPIRHRAVARPAPRRGHTVPAEDRRQPRRHHGRGIRRDGRRREAGPRRLSRELLPDLLQLQGRTARQRRRRVYSKSIAWIASPMATQQCIIAFGKTDFREDLEKFDVPTLIVHGDADQIVPFEISGRRRTPSRGSRLEVIAGAPARIRRDAWRQAERADARLPALVSRGLRRHRKTAAATTPGDLPDRGTRPAGRSPGRVRRWPFRA